MAIRMVMTDEPCAGHHQHHGGERATTMMAMNMAGAASAPLIQCSNDVNDNVPANAHGCGFS